MNKEIIFDEAKRASFLSEYIEKNKDACVTVVGRSILGRDIHCYKIGTGERVITLFGAHHSTERKSTAALYDLIDFLTIKSTRGAVFCDVNIGLLLQLFTFLIVPCPNPDGVEMSIAGASKSPLYERQVRMNGGSEDFSEWQANARGVDLDHNYSEGYLEYKRGYESCAEINAGAEGFSGEHPESEPESHSLANLLRTVAPSALMSFGIGNGVIYPAPDGERSLRIAARLADSVGYSSEICVRRNACGSLVEYAGTALRIPSFFVRLAVGEHTAARALSDIVRKLTVMLCKLL